ncbi:MAG: polysaccharide biosynthesis C-terminal domain-containing protein [Pseudomonadota bacterium]
MRTAAEHHVARGAVPLTDDSPPESTGGHAVTIGFVVELKTPRSLSTIGKTYQMSVSDTFNRLKLSGARAVALDWLTHVWAANDERAATQRSALVAFSVRVGSAALLYLSQIAMARWMGTFDYGVYVFAWTWILLLGGLSHCGLDVGAMRLVSQYREHGQTALERGIISYGRRITAAVSTLVAILGGLGLYIWQDQLASHYVWPLYLAFVCIPLVSLAHMNDGIGRANGWMVAGLLPPYILRPLILLLTMACLYATGFEMGATSAVGAAIFATWLALIIQFVMIQRKLPDDLKRGEKRLDLSGWVRMSLPMLTISGCEMFLQYTDVLVVSAYMSPEQVGIYFAAAKTMALILFVHYAVGSATAKIYAGHHARGDTAALAASVRDAVNWTFWPSLACGIFVLLLGQPILWLFGSEFVSGYPVMMILVLGYLMRAAMGPAEFLLNMAGEQMAGARIYAFAAVFNLVLNVLLVPQFGLYGAATATAIATATTALLCGYTARRKLGIDIAIWSNIYRPRAV